MMNHVTNNQQSPSIPFIPPPSKKTSSADSAPADRDAFKKELKQHSRREQPSSKTDSQKETRSQTFTSRKSQSKANTKEASTDKDKSAQTDVNETDNAENTDTLSTAVVTPQGPDVALEDIPDQGPLTTLEDFLSPLTEDPEVLGKAIEHTNLDPRVNLHTGEEVIRPKVSIETQMADASATLRQSATGWEPEGLSNVKDPAFITPAPVDPLAAADDNAVENEEGFPMHFAKPDEAEDIVGVTRPIGDLKPDSDQEALNTKQVFQAKSEDAEEVLKTQQDSTFKVNVESVQNLQKTDPSLHELEADRSNILQHANTQASNDVSAAAASSVKGASVTALPNATQVNAMAGAASAAPQQEALSEDANVQSIFQKVQAMRRGTGSDEVVLQLEPENLGKMLMKVVQADEQINVEMRVENQAAKQLIESSLSSLRAQFIDETLPIAQMNVTVDPDGSQFGQGFEQFAQSESHHQSSSSDRTSEQQQSRLGNRQSEETQNSQVPVKRQDPGKLSLYA